MQEPPNELQEPENELQEPFNETHESANELPQSADETHESANDIQKPPNETHESANETQRFEVPDSIESHEKRGKISKRFIKRAIEEKFCFFSESHFFQEITSAFANNTFSNKTLFSAKLRVTLRT